MSPPQGSGEVVGPALGEQARMTRLWSTALSLDVDRVTAEVVTALRERGIPSVLLKGPVLVRWLYADGEVRPYGDTDVLVPVERFMDAQAVLRELGFGHGAEREDALPTPVQWGDEDMHALHWRRDDREVDLHWTLDAITVEPERVWGILAAGTERQTVAGVEVDVLGLTGRAFHVAVHAAQHGREKEKSLRDLERALEVVAPDTWAEAAALAARLGATPSFAAGLRLLPAGAEVAARLELPTDMPATVAMRAATPPALAMGFARLSAKRGLRARAAYVLHELAPDPDWMRMVSPLARRGRLGLALAYVARPPRMAHQALPGYLAWRRARRGRARGG